MTRDDFVNRFGPIEEFVLTFDPFMGPNITDLETRANYVVSEEDYQEIMILFRSIYESKKD
jgi:hypothetical protein